MFLNAWNSIASLSVQVHLNVIYSCRILYGYEVVERGSCPCKEHHGIILQMPPIRTQAFLYCTTSESAQQAEMCPGVWGAVLQAGGSRIRLSMYLILPTAPWSWSLLRLKQKRAADILEAASGEWNEACEQGWQPNCLVWVGCSDNVVVSTSHNSIGLQGHSEDSFIPISTVFVGWNMPFMSCVALCKKSSGSGLENWN
jgi:hypothetical protein